MFTKNIIYKESSIIEQTEYHKYFQNLKLNKLVNYETSEEIFAHSAEG